ncbi:MAG: sensor histidine kinase, partial [Bacteroidetes bacterium]|nr:sensor histidine kinase [Bacteroidota bacterium]
NEYLGKLTGELVESLQSPDLNLQLKTEVDSVLLDVDQAVPVGLIINELICNAVKYAFPDQRIGELSVNLSREGNLIRLVVSDNGVGLEEKIQEKGVSPFGLKLVNLLAEKLNANMNVETRNGTRFTFTFAQKS